MVADAARHFFCPGILAAAAMLVVVAAAAAPSDGAATVVVEVASASAFRLGVRFNGAPTRPIASPMTDPSALPAPSVPAAWGGMAGLATAFGALLAAPDGSSWALYDAANNTLVEGRGAPSYAPGWNASADPGITLPVSGAAAGSGSVEACLNNGVFGPPFYFNTAAGYLVLAASAFPYDPKFPHCYPVTFNSAPSAGAAVRAPRVGGDPSVCSASTRRSGMDVTNPVRSPNYPGGAHAADADACCALCVSDPLCYAWVAGPGDATGNCWPLANYGAFVAVGDRTFGGGKPPPPPASWWAMGDAADWYAPVGCARGCSCADWRGMQVPCARACASGFDAHAL